LQAGNGGVRVPVPACRAWRANYRAVAQGRRAGLPVEEGSSGRESNRVRCGCREAFTRRRMMADKRHRCVEGKRLALVLWRRGRQRILQSLRALSSASLRNLALAAAGLARDSRSFQVWWLVLNSLDSRSSVGRRFRLLRSWSYISGRSWMMWRQIVLYCMVGSFRVRGNIGLRPRAPHPGWAGTVTAELKMASVP